MKRTALKINYCFISSPHLSSSCHTRAFARMNQTLLLFLSTVCALLSLLIFIYIGKQVGRLITARTSPARPPVHRYTPRDSESIESSIDVPLPVIVPQATAALLVPETARHERLRYDRTVRPIAFPEQVIYATTRRQEPSLVFAPAEDHT